MDTFSKNSSEKKSKKKSKKHKKFDGKYSIPYLKSQKVYKSKSEEIELTSKEQVIYILNFYK